MGDALLHLVEQQGDAKQRADDQHPRHHAREERRSALMEHDAPQRIDDVRVRLAGCVPDATLDARLGHVHRGADGGGQGPREDTDDKNRTHRDVGGAATLGPPLLQRGVQTEKDGTKWDVACHGRCQPAVHSAYAQLPHRAHDALMRLAAGGARLHRDHQQFHRVGGHHLTQTGACTRQHALPQ
eukprot:ctg_1014.g319